MSAAAPEYGKLKNVSFEKKEILPLIFEIMSGEIFIIVSVSECN
jgi:hypothetical protein